MMDIVEKIYHYDAKTPQIYSFCCPDLHRIYRRRLMVSSAEWTFVKSGVHQMAITNEYLKTVFDGLKQRNADQLEFLQAVEEVLESL